MNSVSNEEIIWNFLFNKIHNSFGVAGLMGNLFAESGLDPENLQNSGNKKLSMSDQEYTKAVDSGKYNNFVKDSQGYGLAQWTYWTRKQELFSYAKNQKVSIGNLRMQLEFLCKEFEEKYKGVFNTLQKATSVKQASNCVLHEFERPANQSILVENKRYEYSMVYYQKFANKNIAEFSSVPYKIRSKRSIPIKQHTWNDSKTITILEPGVYTIIKYKKGRDNNVGWGKLKSELGWISLDLVEIIS